MLKRLVVVGLLAALAGSACGPGPESEGPRAERVAAAKQLLLPPQGPTLPPIQIDPCIVNPGACTDTFTNLHPTVGRGWNLISDQDAPSTLSCLQPYTISAQTFTSPAVTAKVSFASDVRTIKDRMSLDGRVGGGMPASNLPVSGSVYGNMSRTTTATTSAIQLMIYSKVAFAPVRITSVPKITTGALARFDSQGAAAFRNACGDKYVDEASMGAELFGVIRISSSDTTVQSKVRAGLSVAIGTNSSAQQAANAVANATGADKNANFNLDGKLSTLVDGKTVTIEVDFFQNGGPLKPNPISLQDLVTRFQEFPVSLTNVNELRVVGVSLKPYTQTQNIGTRVPFSMTDSTSAMTRAIGPAYLALTDAFNELSFALSVSASGAFFTFDRDAAADLMDQCAVQLLDLEDLVESCGQGQGCTEALVNATIGNSWRTIRSQLPIRRQLYTLSGKDFKAAADAANIISTETGNFTSSIDGCHIDTGLDSLSPNAVRVWTSGGIIGGNCTYRLFNSGALVAPWDIQAFDLQLDSKSALERGPTKSDLTMRIGQYSLPWSMGKALLKTITLAGPQADPALAPWTDAFE